ncbi:hypothetical protein M1506_01350 [Patescibacteria group bacterium]|nr:hypothetical protein [Patescibacteria group bacterium]
MNKKSKIFISLLVVAGILTLVKTVFLDGKKEGQSDLASVSSSNSGNSGMKLSDAPFYNNAFEIFPSLGPGAETALDGFDLSVKNAGNGLSEVTLTSKKGNYKNQTLAVKDGEKVYFVERSMGDDSTSTDYAYADDYAIIVDGNGYILK